MTLAGRTVFVSGASSGIGEAVARQLAEAGCRLILAARRRGRVLELGEELAGKHDAAVLPLELDIRDRLAVEAAIDGLPPAWREIDILINNAGLSRMLDPLDGGNPDDWDEMLDTNVKGMLYLSRAIVPGMRERNRGHVINLGSLAGRQTYPGGAVYCASKAAVRALSEGLKQDLLGSAVRVTEIAPGMVDTEFSTVRFHGDASRAGQVYRGLTPLAAADIAEVVLFALSRPAHVNISEVLLMPVAQSGSMLVHRGEADRA